MKIIVAGLGNPLMGDDGVGGYIIDRLREEADGEKLKLIKADTLLNVIDEIEEADDLIIVDATLSGKRAGTITLEELRENTDTPPQITPLSHGLYLENPKTILQFLQQKVKRIRKIGIEAADLTLGADLTPEVKQSADKVIEFILRMIK